MAKTILLFIALSVGNALAAERPEDRWNLADMYPSVKAWQEDGAKLESQLKAFAGCRGKLGESAPRLKSCLDAYLDFTKRYARLETYASQILAEDTGSHESLELADRARALGAQREEALAFVKPELLRLGKARLEGLLKEDKSLGVYRHYVDDIVRMKAHTLDAKGEGIVASFELSQGATGSTYQILSNAELPWPTVKLTDGKEAKLDQSAYTEHREAQNRDDRKKVFEAFWGKGKEFERTFGVTLHESLKKDTVYTRVRKYPSTLSRSLDRERLPPAVYETLIAETNKGLPTLHRYFRLRARMLGLKDGEMRYYDIYPPLVASSLKYPLDQAKKMVLESVKPLGERYVGAMAKGFENRWMDAYP